MIYIDVDKLKNLAQMMIQYQPILIDEEISNILNGLPYEAMHMKSSLHQISSYAQQISQLYQLVYKHINTSISVYESLEKNIQNDLNQVLKIKLAQISYDTHTSLSEHKTLYSYWKNGVCAGGSMAFSAIDIHSNYQSKYVNAKLSGDVLRASASIDGRLKFTNDGKTFMPALIVSTKGSIALVQSGASLSLGNQQIHADFSGNADLGIAYAEAEAVFRQDEITLKGDVGAAAIKVSGKGSISLFGVTISVTAKTSLGSVGAGVEFSAKEGSLSFGADAALLAGVGLKFDIDY